MVGFGIVLMMMSTGTHLTLQTDVSFDISSFQITPSFYDTIYTNNLNENHCDWLPMCICRDESDYTNGTYRLMVNCTQSGLYEIPDGIPNSTTVLTLDGNYIQDIKPGAFKNLVNLKYLDLSDNFIREIHEEAFRELKNLLTLELSGNNIRYDNISLPNTVFKPLKNLERLNLHQKLTNVSGNEYYPTEALSKLENLKQLLIDGIVPKNLSSAFSKMPRLNILDLSSKYGRCNLDKIVVGMFHDLDSVYDLKISNCSLNFVEKGRFAELANLTILDLSYNEKLQFKSLAIKYIIWFARKIFERNKVSKNPRNVR
jgi:Leucine-rich repeat (LRR) protein